ncbi:type IV pilus modification protein PilV [Methylocaldum sp.]|uniref:type IV pilus modification protein PilV n=1 Tax=Methylocaldum sp. TaxID=1969727 RepID=UPI002D4679FB|nr:type IV pilus modification protein PilV [Methylocaldum sp.]HYE34440.1 type IV pilus modification protein PilV [Methylocaldum sp.]
MTGGPQLGLGPGFRARQQGFTMIEVLITMLVIGMGLLGQAKLLTTTLSHNNSAYMRSVATVLAYDVLECMRGNRAAAINGSYNIALGSSPSGGSVVGDDLVYWKTQLSTALPAGDGSIAVNLGGTVTIVIRWEDNHDGTTTSLLTQTTL